MNSSGAASLLPCTSAAVTGAAGTVLRNCCIICALEGSGAVAMAALSMATRAAQPVGHRRDRAIRPRERLMRRLPARQQDSPRPCAPAPSVWSPTSPHDPRSLVAVWVAVQLRTASSRQDQSGTLVQLEPIGTTATRAANAVGLSYGPSSSRLLPTPGRTGRDG